MSVRFLHTADWQMGMKGSRLGDAALRLAKARLEALDRVMQLAQEHEVQCVLACGDLFEHNQVHEDLVMTVGSILGAYPEVMIHAIPGNHDLAGPSSVWNRLPLRRLENLELHASYAPTRMGSLVLHPLPVRSRHQGSDPLDDLPDLRSQEGIHVALAHGHLTTVDFGAHEDEIRLPLSPAGVTRSGLDYLALGHWHGTQIFKTADGVARIAYSGTHEQTHYRETDAGQVLLVEIEAQGATPKITPLRSGGLHWSRLKLDFISDADLLRLDDMLTADQADFLRLELSGELPLSLLAPLQERLGAERKNRLDLRIKDQTLQFIHDGAGEGLTIDDPSLSLVYHRLQEALQANEDDPKARDANREALALFSRLVEEELG